MKLFVTDLDRTLMDDDHRLSDVNKQALKTLEKHGIQIAFASGRSYENVLDICKGWNMNPHIIASNGAVVYDHMGRLLYKQPLDFDIVKEVLSFCDEHNMMYQLFSNEGRYSKLIDNLIYELIALGKNRYKEEAMILHRAQSFFDLIYHNPLLDHKVMEKLESKKMEAYKIEISCSRMKLLDEIKGIFQQRATVTKSTIDNIEITHLNTHKAIGLEKLCKHLNISKEYVIAAGDNYNDKEMLEYAGISIAVDNAVDDVKNICDYISEQNTEDGVGKMIYKLLEEQLI